MKTYTFVIRFDNGIDLNVLAPSEEIAKDAIEEYLSENRDEIIEDLLNASQDADPCILGGRAMLVRPAGENHDFAVDLAGEVA